MITCCTGRARNGACGAGATCGAQVLGCSDIHDNFISAAIALASNSLLRPIHDGQIARVHYHQTERRGSTISTTRIVRVYLSEKVECESPAIVHIKFGCNAEAGRPVHLTGERRSHRYAATGGGKRKLPEPIGAQERVVPGIHTHVAQQHVGWDGRYVHGMRRTRRGSRIRCVSSRAAQTGYGSNARRVLPCNNKRVYFLLSQKATIPKSIQTTILVCISLK